jgi:hypothetical protein
MLTEDFEQRAEKLVKEADAYFLLLNDSLKSAGFSEYSIGQIEKKQKDIVDDIRSCLKRLYLQKY